MGLTVMLQSEQGRPLDRIDDPANLLHRLLPLKADSRFPWVSTIDQYGDTIFNRRQCDLVLQEWRQLASAVNSPDELLLLQRIESMLSACSGEPHLYVKFIGD